jgi:rubrerythrin
MKVIDVAIELEEMGKHYFERLANETTLAGIKGVFEFLADEQEELYDVFQAMKRGASSHCNADSQALDQARGHFARIFAEDGGALGLLKDDLQAYAFAMAIENRIVSFFEDLAMHERDAESRALLQEIVAEERRHRETVAGVYNFVAAPKWQLCSAEFSNLREN